MGNDACAPAIFFLLLPHFMRTPLVFIYLLSAPIFFVYRWNPTHHGCTCLTLPFMSSATSALYLRAIAGAATPHPWTSLKHARTAA